MNHLCADHWAVLFLEPDFRVAGVCTVWGTGACTTNQVQHTQDIFSLSGFTEANIGCPDNQYYEAGYQLGLCPNPNELFGKAQIVGFL